MLNRLSLTLGLLLLAILVAPPVTAAPNAATVSREFNLSPADLHIRTADGLDFLDLSGGANAMPEGSPDLPLLPVHLGLPEDTELVDMRVVPLEWQTLPGTYRPAGVGTSEPGKWMQPAAIRPDILSATTWYPGEPLRTQREGHMRGHTLAAATVAPVSWNPATGEVRLLTRFRVEATTRPATPDPDAFRILRESPAGRRSFGEALTELTGADTGVLGTAEMLEPLVNSGTPFAPTFRPSLDGSPVEMVIITTSEQEAEYQRLADARTKLGITTVVRTLDWIRANYPNGVDTEETIRFFIKDAVSKWGTAWIVIGGDTDEVPIRYGFTIFYDSEDIPTDLYYTDLDGNWNADGDAIFGEGYHDVSDPGDDVDLYPDVWVGRMPTNDVAEAQNLVDKTLAYMQSPPLGYQNDFLMLAEVLFPSSWTEGTPVQFDGAVLAEDVIDSMLVNQQAVRLYENYNAWPGSLPETKSAVIDSVNAGFGLVHHVGHGYINTMSVGLNAATLINQDVDAFMNGDETFLLYAINCTSAAVDFNCIAERFLANTNGGAIAVAGSTRLDFPSTGRFYQNEFYHLLLRNGVRDMGKAAAMSKVPFIPFAAQDNPHRWTQFTQIFMGDPALEFWTAVPGSLSVVHDPTFELGQGTYTVTVSLDGSPLDSARVALYKADDDFVVGTTDALGQVTLPFQPDEAGSFSVGVQTTEALPYLGTADVVAPAAAPYVYAASQSIDDDATGGSSGNSDARFDAGETVELGFSLKNSGTTGETGITAELSTTDPYITISDSTSAFPDLSAGATVSASDPMVVSVSRFAPDRLEAKCTLTVTGATDTYTEEIILYVHAPIFEYYHQSVQDSIGSGNDDGIIAPGEDFAIVPRIRNLGLGDARTVEARLRSTSPAVTITDSVSVLGDIVSGGIVTNIADGFALSLSDTSGTPDLRVVLLDAYGAEYSQSIDVRAPAEPMNLVTYGGATSIAIAWDPVADADLWGYAVYRAPSELGPFTRINVTTTDGTSFYRDESLPALTRFYYETAAIDSSGNEGPRSVTASATTTLPMANGFPVEVVNATTGGITLADLDGDDQLEILGAGEEIYAVRYTGDDFYNADADVRTLGPITNTGGQLFWNTPAVGDVDKDGSPEIAGVTWTSPKLWLVDNTGVALPGWPRDVDPFDELYPNPLGSVCMADIDADGDLELLVMMGKALLGWHHDGTEIIDGDNDPGTDGVMLLTGSAFSYGTPTVANIDDDPYPEIIVGMRNGSVYVFNHDGTLYPGFPFVTGGEITSSPAVGDIDLDGRMEIVVASSDNNIYAFRADGSGATGFPVGIQLQADMDSSPALGDVDGDGYPDIVIGASNGAVFVYRGNNGSIPAGFPVQIVDNLGAKVVVNSSPGLADVDNDGSLDILVGDAIGRLHCFDNTGIELPGFPIQTGNILQNTPAVWDVDGDGLTEVVEESYDQKIYCWDTPWTFNPNLAVWPMFKRDQRNSGTPGQSIFARTAVPDDRPAIGPLLLQNYPNPFLASTSIRYRIPETSEYVGVALRVYDMNGRVVRTLVNGEQPPGLHELRWDGRDDRGLKVASGIYPYRLEVGGQSMTRKLVLLK